MQPSQINQADLLDILFADRNKQYGAYPLRRGYNKRLLTSLFITGAITLLALAGYYAAGEKKDESPVFKIAGDVTLQKIVDVEELPPPPPPPPPPPSPPQVAVRQYTTFVVVNDDRVDAPPPELSELDHARVGLINQQGIDDVDFVAPPVSDNRGIIEVPATKEDDNEIFRKVEIESGYPGGISAWRRFLIKTLKYPEVAQENGIQGTVMVNFVVDKEGNVSDIKAIAGPEELQTEAIRVIAKSGKWTPAIQNGRQVKSYKLQQITFQLATE